MDTKTDPADSVTILESEHYSLFVLHGHLAILVDAIHDEGQGR
jgi:hypothetical protein